MGNLATSFEGLVTFDKEHRVPVDEHTSDIFYVTSRGTEWPTLAEELTPRELGRLVGTAVFAARGDVRTTIIVADALGELEPPVAGLREYGDGVREVPAIARHLAGQRPKTKEVLVA